MENVWNRSVRTQGKHTPPRCERWLCCCSRPGGRTHRAPSYGPLESSEFFMMSILHIKYWYDPPPCCWPHSHTGLWHRFKTSSEQVPGFFGRLDAVPKSSVNTKKIEGRLKFWSCHICAERQKPEQSAAKQSQNRTRQKDLKQNKAENVYVIRQNWLSRKWKAAQIIAVERM